MKNIYYWICSYPLEKGSVVNPGNWGRILDFYIYPDASANYLKEKIFEEVRRENYSAKPSRLKSIFLCETLEEIRKFKMENNRNLDLIYKVKLVMNAPIFRTNYQLMNIPNGTVISKIEAFAQKYWSEEPYQNIEILVEAKIEILERVAT